MNKETKSEQSEQSEQILVGHQLKIKSIKFPVPSEWELKGFSLNKIYTIIAVSESGLFVTVINDNQQIKKITVISSVQLNGGNWEVIKPDNIIPLNVIRDMKIQQKFKIAEQAMIECIKETIENSGKKGIKTNDVAKKLNFAIDLGDQKGKMTRKMIDRLVESGEVLETRIRGSVTFTRLWKIT